MIALGVIAILITLATIGILTMSAIDSLNANLVALRQTADQLIAIRNAPPVPPGPPADEAAVQAAADAVASITADLRATLPAIPAPTA